MFKGWTGEVPKTWEDICALMPGGNPREPSKELQQWGDSFFEDAMFCDDKAERKTCVCSHCHEKVSLPWRTSHLEVVNCPHCRKRMQVLHLWRGMKKKWQGHILVWFDKAIDGKAIIGRMFYTDRNPEKRNYAAAAGTTGWDLMSVIVYQYGYGGTQYISWSDGCGYMRGKEYDIIELRQDTPQAHRHACRESLLTAADGTPFEWSCWDKMGLLWKEGVGAWRYLDLFARYEGVEYLAKMRMSKVVRAYMNGYANFGRNINWHGHTPSEIFKTRTTKEDRIFLHYHGKDVDPTLLCRWMQVNKLTVMSLPDCQECFRKINIMPRVMFRYVQIEKGLDYLNKQTNCTTYEYDDYLENANLLGLDMKSKSVLYPKNLAHAHDNVIKQVSMHKNELLEKEYQKRRPALLKKYKYEWDGLRVVVPETVADLIVEGRKQNNCVGTYMQRVAKGDTNVMFIREVLPDGTTSEKSYITMEVCRGRIVQARTKNNGKLDARGEMFVEAFRKGKIEKINKERVSA